MVSNIFKNRIILKRENACIYTQCPFCDGMIPIDFNPLHDIDQVRIKGKCKKCESYIQVRTHRFNIVTDWEI